MTSFINSIRQTIAAKKIHIFGKDDILTSSVPYYLITALMLYGIGFVWTQAWSLIFIAYVLLPYLDEFFTLDLRNPTEQERKELIKSDIYFKFALFTSIVIDWVLFWKILSYFSTFQFTLLGTFNLIALWMIFSNINAVQFATAHQIFHKQESFYRILGTIHMVKNLYMHFTYEHLYGHHRKVATPQDPASAQQGMNVYEFFKRSYFGSYKSVYKMQKQLNKPFYLNYSVLSVVASVVFTSLVYYVFGMQATIFFLLEAFLSIFYLEAINFIQHYGLERKKLHNGEYEKVTIRHSWNSPHRFSNYLLFKLQRHSDHHENSLKPYQTLLTLDQSPHLPQGYTLMILISFFPQTWRNIMDPLVDEYRKHQIGRIKSEVIEKSDELTRKFVDKLAVGVTCCWGVTLLYPLL